MHHASADPGADDPATALALAARDGDETALIALIEATQADVWRFCAHLAGRSEADDMTQETFVRAVRGLPRFVGRSTVRTWLLAIARRVVADAARAGARRARLFGALHGSAATDDVAGRQRPDPADAVAMQHLIDHLRDDRRLAFLLTQQLGYSYAEAAVISRCPVGTIRSRVARARADLISGLEAGPADAPSAKHAPHGRTDAERDQPPAR
ncbi:MAG: sigma-70 family RNA polymerase sigma factor [Actinomycetota bacterium]|nr:sigma-70 family RNA polymerase sigma factor [Actinomycetota bacterium]